MNPDGIKTNSAELMTVLTDATIALTTIQGIELGFFDWIPATRPISAQELSVQLGYDINRVDRWLRFAEAYGYLKSTPEGFTLTEKGGLLRRGTPVPDLLGLHHMVGFFTKAVSNSRDAYQKGTGLDSISQGKISRDYIPRVAAHLSKAAAEFFRRSGLASGHSILDLGCGDGSVLRETVRTCPGVSATGIDLNPHTLEIGKRKNADAGLQDQIDLQVGDVTNLTRLKDGAFDWVYAINVFHFLPLNKREHFLREMMRVSRYGIFANQVIAKNMATLSADVLLSTLFTDFTGFFTEADADALIAGMGNRHYDFFPIIQGESRLIVMITAKNDVPLKHFTELDEAAVLALERRDVTTGKDFLTAGAALAAELNIDAEQVRPLIFRTLFP